MRMRWNVPTLLLTALLAAVGVQAQSQTGPETRALSLEQAREHALLHNRNMQKASLALEQAEMAKWAAIANYLPQASINVNYQSNLVSDSISLGAFKIAMKPSSTMTLQVAQPIVNWNIIVGIQMAEIARKMSENAIGQTELAIKQAVNTTYYAILVSEFSRDQLKKNLENVRTLANATRIKVNVGIGESTEADQMEVTVANLENSLTTMERNIEVAYNSLRLLLGMQAEDALIVTDKLVNLTDNQKAFDLLLEPFVPENNLDLKTSALNVQLSEKQVSSSFGAILPTVNAVYQRNEKLLTSAFDITMKNTLLLTANVPLFAGGKNAVTIKKAKLALQASQLDHEQAKDQLLVQEKQLRYNLKSALESFEIQKKNIEVTQRVFDNITKKYEQGLSSSIEVTNANNNLLTAQSNYVSAVMNMLNAEDELLKLLGTL
ncbi:MAG: Outer membrane efflux protein BepC precursor [Bacteroidetes bacterium ADurb.Bin416]|nr:MAG: Outer membrane efflux protein BepC precursor [Bacteroidetes bacterium ADurb.Bin416]